MSVKAWCDYNNVSDKSYYYWLRKIRLDVFEKLSDVKDYSLPIESKSNSSMIFAPIQLDNTTVIADTAIVLTINGITMQIHNGASRDLIENTVQALKSLC
jgi:hypothetical protein